VSIPRWCARWWLVWLAVPALLFVALRRAPLDQVGEALAHLGTGQALVLVLINLCILLSMTARWGLLIQAFGGKVALHTLLTYRLAGFGVSYFTPGPQFGGEPLQVHLLHRWQAQPLDVAIASVFLDRLVDMLVNFTFLAVGIMVILLAGVEEGYLGPGAWVFVLGVLLFPLSHLFALRIGRRPAAGLLRYLSTTNLGRWNGLDKVIDLTARAEGQIGELLRERPLVFVQVVGLAVLTWMGMIAEFWLSLRFLGVSASLPQTISALTAARLAFLVPLPAGMGALEASLALAASMLGWDQAVGIALSLVIRARDLFLALLGLGVAGWPSLKSRFYVQKERI
jgi:glycosyltransferase 2 family protein